MAVKEADTLRSAIANDHDNAKSVEASAALALEAVQRSAAERDEDARREKLQSDKDRNALLVELHQTREQLAASEEELRRMLASAAAAAAATGGGGGGRLALRDRTHATPPAAAVKGGRSRQSPQVVSRVLELGRANTIVSEIDATLSREQHTTSTGTLWPRKNDGRVVSRLLLRHGIQPNFGNDRKLEEYAMEYVGRMASDAAAELRNRSSYEEEDDEEEEGMDQEQVPPSNLPLASAPGGSNGSSRSKKRPPMSKQQQQAPPAEVKEEEAVMEECSERTEESVPASELSSEWRWEAREEAAVRERTRFTYDAGLEEEEEWWWRCSRSVG